MSLANFFDKAALGASSILKGFDRLRFAESLSSKSIGICFDSEAAESSEAKVALDLTVNLLARLYPKLAIHSIGEPARNFEQALIRLAQEINPQIEFIDTIETSGICIVVGKTCPNIRLPKIYIGSQGWVARISTSEPFVSGNSDNPFGAAVAACISAANVFRFIFADQLEVAELDKSLRLSLIDLDPSSDSPLNPPLKDIDLGESHIIGIGAIGNGAAWVLRKTRHLGGTLNLIDPEALELSNLQRYVLATQSDVGTPKVDIAARNWSGSVTIHTHQLSWADYLQKSGAWNIERVAVAVDSAADRCAVQSSLPRFIINAWTRGGNLGISRHSFLGDQACLACLYLPAGREKNEDELIAEAIGLPTAVREIRDLLYYNSPVNASLLDRIAKVFHLDQTVLSAFEGMPIRRFYSEAVCGGALLRLGSVTSSGSIEVPMAFQSALAGIMLAAELVIYAGNLRVSRFPTITQIDFLKPMGTFLSAPAIKDVKGKCICQDQDYIAAFRRKYATP